MIGGVYQGQAYPGQGYPAADTGISPPFIAATTTVYAPTLSGSGVATLTVPFIASTTTVYSPVVDYDIQPLDVPFIAATSSVYAPTLVPGTATLTAPYIAAATVVYTPTLRKSGIGAQPLGVSIAFDDPVTENAPTWTRLDA